MPSYPVNPRRAASVVRRPVRVGPVCYLLRRLMRAAISPVLAPLQRARQTQLALLPTLPGRVVLLGDSITEGGVWNELLPELPVLNRGVGGETSAQVLARLDLVLNAPSAVVLLIGTNDLSSGVSTALRPEFTEDKLHLNGAGYRAWVDVLRPVVELTLITTKES